MGAESLADANASTPERRSDLHWPNVTRVAAAVLELRGRQEHPRHSAKRRARGAGLSLAEAKPSTAAYRCTAKPEQFCVEAATASEATSRAGG